MPIRKRFCCNSPKPATLEVRVCFRVSGGFFRAGNNSCVEERSQSKLAHAPHGKKLNSQSISVVEADWLVEERAGQPSASGWPEGSACLKASKSKALSEMRLMVG